MANPTKYAEQITIGTNQFHYYPGENGNGPIDNTLDMTFGVSGYTQHYGHHARLGSGNDTFNFKSTANVKTGGLVVGRLEDFNPTKDRITVEGKAIDLNKLPSNMKVVLYNGDHNDVGSDPQQWLLITTSTGGHIFYALEGARVDETGDGDSNDGQQEHHFISKIPDFSKLTAVAYENPFNYVPAGYSPDGGKIIEDFEIADPTGDRPGDQVKNDIVTPLVGTSSGDLIAGGLNDDIIQAGSGRDLVWGGDGGDTIDGQYDNDLIWGNKGNDSLVGGLSGKDTLYGGNGDDSIFGGTDTDTLSGDEGNDHLRGDDGNDKVYGGNGNDLMYGGEGNDFLYGQGGNDSINGDAGTDVLNGGSGDDRLNGGDGNDQLYAGTNSGGGAGSDKFSGGQGADQFIFGGKIGFVEIMDFEDGADKISFAGTGINDIGDLNLQYVSGSDGYVKITLDSSEGDGGVIRIYGVELSKITAADFIF